MKSENLEISQYLVISYIDTVVKKIIMFRTFCYIHHLQMETSPK
jgi:hypothetical protein